MAAPSLTSKVITIDAFSLFFGASADGDAARGEDRAALRWGFAREPLWSEDSLSKVGERFFPPQPWRSWEKEINAAP